MIVMLSSFLIHQILSSTQSHLYSIHLGSPDRSAEISSHDRLLEDAAMPDEGLRALKLQRGRHCARASMALYLEAHMKQDVGVTTLSRNTACDSLQEFLESEKCAADPTAAVCIHSRARDALSNSTFTLPPLL